MQITTNKIPARTFTVGTALFAAIALPSFVTTANANASLSRVGPALSSSSATAKNQIESLVQHDDGVTAFIARQTKLSASVIAQAEVVSVQKKNCIVGASKTCGYNTGKDASGNVVTTSYRQGTRVAAYVATIEYEKGKTVKVTFLKPCANVLGTSKVNHTKQTVSNSKAIVVKLKAASSATCANGTASASVTVKIQVKSWSSFVKAVASASATCVPSAAGPGPIVLTCTQLGKIETSPGSGVCQANSASSDQDAGQDNNVSNDCPGAKDSCNTTINNTIIQNTTIIQINANCSKVTLTYGDGSQTVQYKDNGGNVVNEEYCTVKTENPPTPTPPAPPVDNAPQIAIVGSPAHVYKGGNVYGYIEASDPDGDQLSVSVSASANAHVAGLVPSTTTYDKSPCPANSKCYRFTLWGDTVGMTTITATVTANGKSNSASADVPVKSDQF